MSAAPGRPQGSHGIDRIDEDYFAFADQCNGLGEPTDTFFPESGKRAGRAKRICQACPVQQACLDYAIKYDERYGIWGGYTETERRIIKRFAREKGAHFVVDMALSAVVS